MIVLVDSDILIEVSRGKDLAIVSRWIELSHSEAAVLYSPVSLAELWAGARPAEHKILEDLFASLTCVPITAAIARLAGAYLLKYAKSNSVELGDALIAACTHSTGAILWTRNRKHYPMKDLSFF